MHGTIMVQLQRFVEQKMGPGVWEGLFQRARLPRRLYLATESYPDAEIGALVSAASEASSTPVQALLESFGEFVVPGLVAIYGAYVEPEWRTLDLLENTEETIHKVVRRQNPNAAPPRLLASRMSANEVLITYSSPRRMCAVARGIIRGVAAHYGEKVQIDEPSCMLLGGRTCELIVRQLD